MFEQLKSILPYMPNLEKEVSNYQDKSYKIISISAYSSQGQYYKFDKIEVTMENQCDNTVYIESHRFNSAKKDDVSVNNIASRNNSIHPGMKLDALAIHTKEFKKSLFRGYDETEVDSFLDIIVSDYEFFRKYILNNDCKNI